MSTSSAYSKAPAVQWAFERFATYATLNKIGSHMAAVPASQSKLSGTGAKQQPFSVKRLDDAMTAGFQVTRARDWVP